MATLPQCRQGSGLPKDSKVAWISTRRGGPAADRIAGHVHSSYVLHDMMRSVKAPLDELQTAHAVVLEAPSNVAHRFEHDMLNLTKKITSQCPNLAVIVQPSLRRKSNKTPLARYTLQVLADLCVQDGKCSARLSPGHADWYH